MGPWDPGGRRDEGRPPIATSAGLHTSQGCPGALRVFGRQGSPLQRVRAPQPGSVSVPTGHCTGWAPPGSGRCARCGAPCALRVRGGLPTQPLRLGSPARPPLSTGTPGAASSGEA